MRNLSLVGVLLVACTAPVAEEPGADGAPEAAPPDAALDAPPVPTGTPIAAARPAIASGVGGQVAVWDTARNGTLDVFGTRLSATGQVLDPDGIAIAVAAGAQVGPRIAFNGERYLVVWRDTRLGQAEIYAARVGGDGTVLDPGGIRVSVSGGAAQFPDVASDGRDFLVVWEAPCAATGCGHGVSGAIVRADGSVGDTVRLGPGDTQSYTPAVAFAGGGYLVAWAVIGDGDHDLAARRVAPDGVPGEHLSISAAAGNQIAPAIAGDGAGFLITWQHVDGGLPRTVAARVAGDGTVLDPDGLAVSLAGRWRDAPDVAWTGAGYLVAWTEATSETTIAVKTRTVGGDGSLSAIYEPVSAPSAGGSPLEDDRLVQLAALDGRITPVWQSPFDLPGDSSFTIVGAQLVASCARHTPPAGLTTHLAR
jgi:hypothetical protein